MWRGRSLGRETGGQREADPTHPQPTASLWKFHGQQVTLGMKYSTFLLPENAFSSTENSEHPEGLKGERQVQKEEGGALESHRE